jgi:hypothetical protein
MCVCSSFIFTDATYIIYICICVCVLVQGQLFGTATDEGGGSATGAPGIGE